MDRYQSFGHLRDIDPNVGRVTAVISTGDVARDDAIIDPAGWDFSHYDRNPVVLWMHNDGALPVARTVSVLATGSELIATAEFDMDDPEAVRLLGKIARGFVNATSVRWNPIRWEWRKMGEGSRDVLVFTAQELLEWSFVSIPADPKALILRDDGAGFDRSRFALTETKPEPEPAVVALDPIYEDVGDRLLALYERRAERPTIADIIVSQLAHKTGKSEDRIRLELAAGGSYV